jgi:hypothetical protein
MRPLAKAATLMPPVAFRYDPGVLISAFGRYLPSLLSGGADAARLTGPYSKVGARHVPRGRGHARCDWLWRLEKRRI